MLSDHKIVPILLFLLIQRLYRDHLPVVYPNISHKYNKYMYHMFFLISYILRALDGKHISKYTGNGNASSFVV